MSATPPRAATVVLTVLIPFGCGYYLSYLFRTVNAVISPHLVREFGLEPADLGFLTSVYFITFAAMQIPLGIILDRYGPRKVQAGLLLVAAAGSALFALGGSYLTLTVGRALIGIGVSSCLMSSFTANAIWWPKERLALMNNLTMAFGSAGALSATAPVHALMSVTDWRTLFLALAVATAVLAVITLMIVPERRSRMSTSTSFAQQFAALPVILKSRQFWRYAVPFAFCYSVYMSYQTLWAAPWLRDVAGLDQDGVANHMFLIQLGLFVGVLGIGVIADKMRARGAGPERLFVAGVAAAILIQVVLIVSPNAFPALFWTAYSLVAAAIVLCYAILTERFPPELTGRVITTVNLMGFICAFSVQWGIGAIIGTFAGNANGGYVPEAHSTALMIMLGLQIGAFIVYYVLRSPVKPSMES